MEHIQHSSAPAQIYLIQLDSHNNRGIPNTPAIPLHIVENKNRQELLIPVVPSRQTSLNLLVDTNRKNEISKNSYQPIQSVSQLSSIQPQHTNDSILQLVDPKTLNSIPHKSNIYPKTNYLPSEVQSKNYYNLQEVLQYPNDQFQSLQQTITNQLKDPDQIFSPSNKTLEKMLINTKAISKVTSKDQLYNEVNTSKQKKQNYIHISDTKVPPRAIAVLPTLLNIRKNEISPRRTLPARIRFGPVQGITRAITESEAKVLACNTQKPVFLLKDNNFGAMHIDVADLDKSNWIGLLPLGDHKTANVWLYEENNKLYAITTAPINARQILKIGYSKKYAEDHQFPPGLPVMDLENVLSVNPKQWWCNECHRALSSASLLQRHVDVYHKEYVPNPRRGYRCRYCKRTFSTLFTVRRHTLQHCSKRGIKSPEKNMEKVASTDTMNSTKYDDNKVPSDESFQNFTNGLDFSTNLFDTDRISNLDISIGSRTDVEFNSYAMTRDDNAMNNDLSKTPNKMERSQDNLDTKAENILDTCGYCDQVLLKHRKRKHASVCPARKLECECGRSFTNKKLLSEHISKEHNNLEAVKNEENKDNARKKYNCEQCEKTFLNEENKDNARKKYNCEQCEKTFLRRGMLANHLWREHNAVTTLPVEKSVKHYPCVACPKIYRSAAKRDRHVKLHHPGADKVKGLSIEGGVKSVEASLCPVCPRQYATRSKLLQHIRAQHPTLALANGKQAKPYKTANKEEYYIEIENIL